MKNAIETIKELIRNKVWMMNQFIKESDEPDETYIETFNRLQNELRGMLICLKNINDDDKFYCTNFYPDRIEFGYYDNESKWFIIEK